MHQVALACKNSIYNELIKLHDATRLFFFFALQQAIVTGLSKLYEMHFEPSKVVVEILSPNASDVSTKPQCCKAWHLCIDVSLKARKAAP